MNIELTKDTDKILCTLYKTYLERIKSGISKNDAIEFEESSILQKQLFTNISVEDLDFSLIELYKANLIKLDITGCSMLAPSAIIYMENRFKNGLSEVIDFISKFIP